MIQDLSAEPARSSGGVAGRLVQEAGAGEGIIDFGLGAPAGPVVP